MVYEDELMHYGILGQKWGIRRYQNPDGTLTDAGKARLSRNSKKLDKLQNKVKSKREKVEKKFDKYSNLNDRSGIFRSEKSIAKAAEKFKSAEHDYDRAIQKATKYYKKLDKRYKDTTPQALRQDQIDLGKEFAQAHLSSALRTLDRLHNE